MPDSKKVLARESLPPAARNFAVNMERRLDQLEISQDRFAEKMREQGFERYNQMTVSRTLRGDRQPTLWEAMAIARALDTTVQTLTEYSSSFADIRQVEVDRILDLGKDATVARVGLQNALFTAHTVALQAQELKRELTEEHVAWLGKFLPFEQASPLRITWEEILGYAEHGLEKFIREARQGILSYRAPAPRGVEDAEAD